MRIHPGCPSLLLFMAVLSLSALSPPSAASRPTRAPRGDEDNQPDIFITVSADAESLVSAVLVDPRGRRAPWLGSAHHHSMPGWKQWGGYERQSWPPYAGPFLYAIHFWARPAPGGAYRLEVQAHHHPTQIGVDVQQGPGGTFCSKGDTCTMIPEEPRTWKLEWSPMADGDTCWVRLRQLPNARQKDF